MNFHCIQSQTSLTLKNFQNDSKRKRKFFTRGSEQELVNVTINGRKLKVPKGEKLIEACRQAHIEVPTLCYHPMLSVVGHCRLCLVEIEGKDKLQIACATTVEEGMNVHTETEKTHQSVVSNLKLLRCRHPNVCMTCEANGRCEFQTLVYKYGVPEILPQRRERTTKPIDLSSNSVVRDMSKCVLCSRCIRACSEIQGMHILGMEGRGGNEVPSPVGGVLLNETACISCGQCTAVCPVGALTEKVHLHNVEWGLLNKKGKIWIASTAPAVRVAISEEFGLAPGTVSTGKLVSALRELGFDYVFDTNFAADLTIVEEATEFIRRLTQKGTLPMFTSCCPGWINLVEKTYPQIMDHLSTCKSPQGMMGALIKNYFSAKLGVEPDQIEHVSIMPCVAKKDEMERPQLTTEFISKDGTKKTIKETDYVLTTRELGRLLNEHRIPFSTLTNSEYDAPLGLTTGAAALFGVTGGVLEAALRTASEMVTGKPLQKIEFEQIRGTAGIREAVVEIGDLKLNVAVAHGTKKVRQLVDEVVQGKSKYQLIEVMACPGGCIGGGGEPKTSRLDPDVIKKRMQAIYEIDGKKGLRKSHENEAVKSLYKEFLGGTPNEGKAHHYLHTHYTDRTNQVKARSETEFGKPPPLDSTHEY